MATVRIPFTFPVGYPHNVFGEIEGVAEVGAQGIEEVFCWDLRGQEYVTVGGQREADIRKYLRLEMGHIILEAEDTARRDTIARDRRIGRAA